MGKFRWKSLLTVVVILLVLGGCSKETEKVVKNMKTHRVAAATEINNRIVEKEMQFVIDVVNPLTKEIIRTFDPREEDENDTDFQAELKSWARDLARGTEDSEGFDQRMVLDKIDEIGQIQKGKPMVILQEEELVKRVLEAMDRGGQVELPLTVTESQYSPDEVVQLDEVVLASYTTYFDSGVVGRAKNIELSASAINNVIFGPGDIFSYNEIVGPRDEESGYQKAMEIVNKELVEGIGGGVCQTSSTLFNAVDAVGVEYIEWHHHSISIGYVPVGRDATVSYGGLDFRFQNPHDVPFLIKAYVDGGSLTVEVRTSKENARKINGEM
ncbi:VanW family protein [Robertmurraya massiliosenegalensis]|uniref:VanW family protein n=1 Tax=Robertmurraya TaxID=2837507 RepID=UPI0039A768BD